MASLRIRTAAPAVYICGDFNGWDHANPLRVERKKGAKYILVPDMPAGFYRVHAEPHCWYGSLEHYPDKSTNVVGRCFAGDTDEVIRCFFD